MAIITHANKPHMVNDVGSLASFISISMFMSRDNLRVGGGMTTTTIWRGRAHSAQNIETRNNQVLRLEQLTSIIISTLPNYTFVS